MNNTRHTIWRLRTVLAIRVLLASCLLAALIRSDVLAAEWQSGPGYRWRDLTVPATGRTFLKRLTPAETGIQFTNRLSEDKGLENSLRTSGGGVAAGDVDGDGWCDLYFCGMESPNALYRNLGNGRFEDITAAAGVACPDQYSTGAVFADVDGDGDLDLLVNSLGGGTRLFLNDGRGKFTEATDRGLWRRYGSTSLALADIDGNGTLDLYVCNYATVKIEDRPNTKFDAKTIDGKPVLTAIDGVPLTSPDLTNRYFVDAERTVRELGEPDVLYRNDGQGRFTPVSWTDGSFLNEEGQPLKLPPYDFGLSVIFRDIDGDGLPDIYVCNDLFPPDRIWINDGRGRFRALSNLAVRSTCRFAMGVDFADINRDGYDDFFVVDMLSRSQVMRKIQTVGVPPMVLPVGKIDNRPQYKRNTLFLNRGDGTYAEIAQLSGLAATEWSWMPAFLDLDLDGYEDLLVTTGHFVDSLHADAVAAILKERSHRKLTDQEHRQMKRKYYPLLHLPMQIFRNRGDLTFEDKAGEWGFGYVGISQGLCLADLDNDGDLDVIVNHLNDGIGIYRNESMAPRVAVRLRGAAPNTFGIGGRIRLLGGPVPQTQEIQCGGRYLSCDDTMRVFAAGRTNADLTIEVTWRDGSRSLVRNVRANRLYEVEQASATRPTPDAPRAPQPAAETPLFTDRSRLLHHVHAENTFEDLEQQPLLGRRLSQLGPGVAWFDLNDDGFDDLIVGTGAGGKMAVFRNDGHGAFEPWPAAVLNAPQPRDQTTVLGWQRSGRTPEILAGSSNYEDGQPGGACVRRFHLDQAAPGESFPGWEIAVGPLAMADVDGDGVLDLFVGGRAEPKRYPDPPSSLLFRGTESGFAVDEENCRRLATSGMVSGAVFSDLDGDGAPDLVVAVDWGAVRIYRNAKGRLEPWDAPISFVETNLGGVCPAIADGAQGGGARPARLSQLKGWWNGVTTGDLDGDGRMDILASNWGRNTKFEEYRARPLRVYFGEWTVKGIVDVFEACTDAALKKEVPWAPYRMAKLLPWVVEHYPTQTAYSTAGIADLLGERRQKAGVLEVNWLETTLFLNRGDHFEVHALPTEAQFSPAFAVCIGDLNGDGNEDVFLGQNFFAVDGDTSRYDGGRGLCLAGDGRGGLLPVPGQRSGVKVYGEQRGAALADYDGDGRLDLVVTQNGAETKLYQNSSSKPGLRVRLQGPSGNPTGVGAMLRLQSGGQLGPAHEIHAGSGYWSQDSAVSVLGSATTPTKLLVRWPGGSTTTTDLPAGVREVTVGTTGQLVRSR
jgi:hypothetical protein